LERRRAGGVINSSGPPPFTCPFSCPPALRPPTFTGTAITRGIVKAVVVSALAGCQSGAAREDKATDGGLNYGRPAAFTPGKGRASADAGHQAVIHRRSSLAAPGLVFGRRARHGRIFFRLQRSRLWRSACVLRLRGRGKYVVLDDAAFEKVSEECHFRRKSGRGPEGPRP